MFLRLNQIIFGGFLYAVQSAILIGVLYVMGSVLLFGFNGILLIIGFTAVAASFFATLLSYFFFMAFRYFRKKGDSEKESWLIPLSAALIINFWLVMVSLQERWGWGFIVYNIIVSIAGVLVSRKIFRKVWARLVELQT